MGIVRSDITLVTGASGNLGRLASAAILASRRRRLLLLLRARRRPEDVVRSIAQEYARLTGDEESMIAHDGLVLTANPAVWSASSLERTLRQYQINEIIHCAGSQCYYDTSTLARVNVGLTRALLAVAYRHRIGRFVYVSSAFCSGYQRGLIREARPARGPHSQGRNKEQRVAGSAARATLDERDHPSPPGPKYHCSQARASSRVLAQCRISPQGR